MNNSTYRRLTAALFACVFACMLVFNFLTPFVSDDFAHYYGNDGTHVSTFSGIVSDLKYLRSDLNGRVVPHFFVYLFLMLPKSVFNVFNAAIAVLILYLMKRFFSGAGQKRTFFLLVLSVFMMWYFMPGFGQVFLWLTGSCNYSWGLAADLAVLSVFFRSYAADKETGGAPCGRAGKLLWMLLAVIAGAWSENGAAATIFASLAFTLLIWIKEKKLPVFCMLLCACMTAGFAFLMLAPAEAGGRTGDLSVSGILDSAKNCLMMTKKYCLPLLASYSAFLALGIVKKADAKRLAASAVLVAAGCVSIAVFAFAAYLPQRSFFIMVTFTVLACLIVMDQLAGLGERKPVAVFAGVAAALFVFSFAEGAGDILSLKMQEKARINVISEAVSSGRRDVTLKAYASSTMYPAVFAEELTESTDGWYNELLAEYYGLDSVSGTGINYYFD